MSSTTALTTSTKDTSTSQAWNYLKHHIGIIIIICVVIYIIIWSCSKSAHWLVGKGGLLDNVVDLAKTFGALWLLLGLITAVLPFLKSIVERFTNNGVDKKVQSDAVNDVKTEAQASNKEITNFTELAKEINDVIGPNNEPPTPDEINTIVDNTTSPIPDM